MGTLRDWVLKFRSPSCRQGRSLREIQAHAVAGGSSAGDSSFDASESSETLQSNPHANNFRHVRLADMGRMLIEGFHHGRPWGFRRVHNHQEWIGV